MSTVVLFESTMARKAAIVELMLVNEAPGRRIKRQGHRKAKQPRDFIERKGD